MFAPPTFLTLGHVTRDLPGNMQYPQTEQKDGTAPMSRSELPTLANHTSEGARASKDFTLGGTVTFAALTAYHLGLAAAIVTCADPELIPQLADYLPHIAIHVRPTMHTTTFANQYHTGFRIQYLYARSAALVASDVPAAWLATDIVLLAPLAQEISLSLVQQFPRRSGRIVAATPQGWLRRWDADGRVWPARWRDADLILPCLDVLILSYDDLLPFANGKRTEADALLTYWSTLVPLLVVTDGRAGATLFQHGVPQHFSAYPAQEVDPTGAGDVFAAAFLTSLYLHNNPAHATAFANSAAAFSIEQPGIQGIPTRALIEQRLTF